MVPSNGSFVKGMNIIIDSFPKKRDLISSQLLRALDSVALVITEGSLRQSFYMQRNWITS